MSRENERKAARRAPSAAARALATARHLVEADRKAPRSGRWLALLPVAVAVLAFLLLVPRATTPEDIPMPAVDRAALARIFAADDARAQEAAAKRLPTDVLAVGGGLRAFAAAQAKGEDAYDARAKLDEAMRALASRGDEAVADLLALRAVQLAGFLAEVDRFERTGEESQELAELGGAFVRRMRDAGWIDGQRVLLDEAERRATFKLVWNAVAAVESVPAFALAIDEQRAIYGLYLRLPHPAESQREELAVERREATTPAACERLRANERRARELWRADKIKRFGAIDPTYPAGYALGVAYFRAGRYESSVDAFRTYLDAHPEGRYVFRARNHLKAALEAYGAI